VAEDSARVGLLLVVRKLTYELLATYDKTGASDYANQRRNVYPESALAP